jgi:chromosome condensin MukBEF MukE localization factor
LNETAREILARCDGRTVAEIVNVLADDYDVDRSTLIADVRETLASLRERKLVELV